MKQVAAITPAELSEMAERMYGSFVKGVVDVKQKLLVVDAEMHVDEEQYLLERGSAQKDLWGINLHPANFSNDDFVEFDSMINIRPSQRNRSRDVEDPDMRNTIRGIVREIVTP